MNVQNLRGIKRNQKPINASVKGRDINNKFWNESIEVISYTRNGASLYLSRECPVGCLVSMLIALPAELRAYDQEREFYRVWGIVQHCSLMKETSKYHVGIAFTGSSAPPSYQAKPSQTYRILGTDENGLWRITETARTFITRKTPRYWITLKINLSYIAGEEGRLEEEEAVTENISLSGAAVLSNLEPNLGQAIEFNFPELDFSAIARLCNIRHFADDKKQLHLEFIDAEFPINKIILPADDSD